ncbi:MAG TPA: hypothetical protein VKR55_13640 [Bradyrhizobium sp.]|uniref:hypothetical protein n=1 Tax=Bradyrhizobium sp. TaxID=376 RepID=UPI002BD7FE71|nr:hypothetical protein [Bradyrhizobium sp.]HLZ03176.1 hypothetical protein [Bradyrhizobium sp.]
MSSVYQAKVEDGIFEEVEAPGAALVPVTATVYRAPRFAVPRPDANFVTQLIATAEQLPQTRNLRRAAPADALTAYQAFEHRIKDAPASTRQMA